MMDLSGIGKRILIEFNRLGLARGDIGKVGGVSVTTAWRYASGEKSPSLEFLQLIERVGANIPYILYGTSLDLRVSELADAIQSVDDLLFKHEVQVSPKVRATLAIKVLDARRQADATNELFVLDLGRLLRLIAEVE